MTKEETIEIWEEKFLPHIEDYEEIEYFIDPEPNCYIGSEGVVDWVDTEDGSFHLRMESGAGLMVGIRRYGRKPEYKYELI